MASPSEDTPGLRLSVDKPQPVEPPAVDRLPDEIIQQNNCRILQDADADSFASLVLLNTNWRRVSQQAELYAYHLSKCPSYAASHSGSPDIEASDDNLPRLRTLFAREVKRNLFEAYLRPAETTIKLISNSISSSSCPGGEGLQFSPSPRGHHILAYNSSRIYILDVRPAEIHVRRELKILRRPASACIKDDGSLLAVLSSEMQVDIYDLTESPPRRTQSIILDNAPRTIAMSPCGSVLAAAYEGGIEVTSLAPGAMPTERRAVKCDAVDSLAFSFDGTQLLGTTIHTGLPNTVVLTAPYYDPGSMMDDNMSALWTTSILFPNTSRDCSHAVLLQDTSREEAAWSFAYDRSFETFRAVRIDEPAERNLLLHGADSQPKRERAGQACALHAARQRHTMATSCRLASRAKTSGCTAFPEDLDAVPDGGPAVTDSSLSTTSASGRRNSNPPSRTPSSRTAQDSTTRPQWQLLCDRLRNTFVWGAKIAELEGVSTVKWVAGFGESSSRERLVVAARGLQPGKSITEEDDIDFVDGGRITLLDFAYGTADGAKKEITIEVGTIEPEVLEEERRDIDAEVAIVRRRTVAQRRGGDRLMRAATTAGAEGPPPVPDIPLQEDSDGNNNKDGDDDPLLPRRIGAPPRPAQQTTATPTAPADNEHRTIMEAQEAVDAPYSHDNPRSTTTLRRAATAAAVNRRRQPQEPAAGSVPYRRADGRREHPHESDADNWVPPPPPYQKDDPVDLPAFLRQPAVTPANQQRQRDLQPPRIQTAAPTVGSAWPLPNPQQMVNQPPIHTRGYQEPPHSAHPVMHRRTNSDSTTMSRPRASSQPRPTTSPSVHDGDDENIYDVSPPDSPRIAARRSSGAQQDLAPPARGAYDAPRRTSLSRQQDAHARRPSTANSPAAPLRNSSYPSDNQGPPVLDLQIPVVNLAKGLGPQTSHPAPSGEPLPRRLSNAQTWPRSPEPSAVQTTPAGRGRPTSQDSASRPFPSIRTTAHTQSPAVEDQPLIISTPGGVTGAFDAPNRRTSGRGRGETPILAPIPRHVQPAIERLDPSYVPPVNTGASITDPRSSSSRFMPSWLSAPSTVSNGRQSHGSISRKPSRAERSAAKNMQDAKRRGWGGSKKKKKRKKQPDFDVASSAAWTDVSAASQGNMPGRGDKADKKCVLM
ncbi:F-box domain-containing protein [Verticillium alfalfae VaMs.102]|uniref:F-box domain-containing protein n=1 Tax=Verticillium alfalfae (strain VaMs.102 / ATCC MYA-4576 / FGSC 10136) TaxID=526221 RepID=C9SIU0_VERA1|nr:F-box domain-containing protein [Verticillium alfalfae VaMs.102]EEY18863.1 F-box domain-containing protein [Verticillium alfalfae VaMs.102]